MVQDLYRTDRMASAGDLPLSPASLPMQLRRFRLGGAAAAFAPVVTGLLVPNSERRGGEIAWCSPWWATVVLVVVSWLWGLVHQQGEAFRGQGRFGDPLSP